MPAYYKATFLKFLADDVSRIVGVLSERAAIEGHTLQHNRQTEAWRLTLDLLKAVVQDLVHESPLAAEWGLLVEYPIPRRQKRIDVVILAHSLVFCIEFKTGIGDHKVDSERQVEHYALDLRDFHAESAGRVIVPVAVTLNGRSAELGQVERTNLVRSVVRANQEDLAKKLSELSRAEQDSIGPLGLDQWDKSIYSPVPTIIEAAQDLWSKHTVRDIMHAHADRQNLSATTNRILELVKEAREGKTKLICFITGVPGAGKTLAGLSVVHDPTHQIAGKSTGVFLSGNGPLVKILTEAIVRDEKLRTTEGQSRREFGTLVQNVHSFVKEGLAQEDRAPPEHMIVFDEAQRAWNADQCARSRSIARNISEPELILSIMDRHDWAVIVALVGGGQEINTGEAGLAEWGRALKKRFENWQVAVSPNAFEGGTSVSMHRLFSDGDSGAVKVQLESTLHLDVGRRSFRAEGVARWVDALIAGDALRASEIVRTCEAFPLIMTRDLEVARNWLRSNTKGFRRCGLLASSGALRLRAHGLELSPGFRQQGKMKLYVDWFLDAPTAISASNQLEIAASEFECQGLELDFVGVCWGGDFMYDPALNSWAFRRLRSNKWNQVRNVVDRQYMLNKYRVLMTRAREGMILWVPRGEPTDLTRLPQGFDSTAEFLKQCGLKELE